MINFIFIYFISYFLSYVGFPLGKVTREEHKELERPIRYTIDILLFIIYISLLYLFRSYGLVVFTTIVLMGLKFLGHYKKKYIAQVHNLLLFSSTLMFAYKYLALDYIYIALLPLFILIFENSFKEKFDQKEEIYSFVLMVIVFALLNAL